MGQRIGLVSTYPPTQCGLATFTASLDGALTGIGVDRTVVVRSLEAAAAGSTAAPGAELVMGDDPGLDRSADRINACDAVIVQHEFGIYGGRDGNDILRLLRLLHVPTVVVLHTVLVEPSPHQREIIEAIVSTASAVVTMTATARERLAANYAVDMAKVHIIAHGVPVSTTSATAGPPRFNGGRPVVLTWGLLGPGKGIEWGIEAMSLLRDLHPRPRYVVAGQTHPKVLARDGEAYRVGLSERIRGLGLAGDVTFEPGYRDARGLAELIASADVVLLPYDSVDQVTSGVLIEAVGAGKPVVATGFPHAVEVLADGTGVVVPHRDPPAVAAALRTILTDRGVAVSMATKAAAMSSQVSWPAIGAQYRGLVTALVNERVPA